MKGLVLLVGILVAVGLLLSFAASQVPGEERAAKAARQIGLRDVEVTKRSYSWGVLGGCHENDVTKFTVVGTDAQGNERTIEVCAPLIGGYTVRS